MSKATIKRVRRDDTKQWQEAVAALVPPAHRDGKLASAEHIVDAAKDDRCYLYVAISDDHTAGLLSAYRFPDVESGGRIVYLYNIEVDVRHRNRGIATLLINELKRDCRADGVTLIWAGTTDRNLAARRAFEKTGAEEAGARYIEYEWELY